MRRVCYSEDRGDRSRAWPSQLDSAVAAPAAVCQRSNTQYLQDILTYHHDLLVQSRSSQPSLARRSEDSKIERAETLVKFDGTKVIVCAVPSSEAI